MVVTGLQYNDSLVAYAFSKDIGIVTVDEIQGDRLDLTIFKGNDVVAEEVYYITPDANKVNIYGLSEYLEMMMPKGMDAQGSAFLSFRLLFQDLSGGLAISLFVKFCMTRTPYVGEAATMTRILSRHRSVRLLPHQDIRFSALVNASQGACKLVLSVTYRKSDNVGFLRTKQAMDVTAGSVSQVDYILTLADIVAKLNEDGYDDVTVDNVLSVIFSIVNEGSGVTYDAIKFSIDRKNHVNLTSFLYANLYGVPELINFYGSSKEEIEGESDFGVIKGEYLKLYDNQNVIRTAYSGYISIIDYRSIVDMTNSSDVFLVDKDNKASRITIVEYELARTEHSSTPIAVNIKYRLSDECQNIFDVESNEEFMNLFDETYTEVYE